MSSHPAPSDWRARWRAHLDGTGEDRRVVFVLSAVIVLACMLLSLETVPSVAERYGPALRIAEWTYLTIFFLEYVVRIIVSARPASYIFSFWGIVDLLAWLPALLFLFPESQALRALRLIRLLRMIELLRFSRALDRLERAIYKIREEIAISLFMAMIVLFLASVGIYHFEHAAQPDAFSSIPASLWWAVASLTTVGYGDVYPITTGGRIFTGFVLLIGLGVVAVPAGIVTAALLSEEPDGQDTNNRDSQSTQHGETS